MFLAFYYFDHLDSIIDDKKFYLWKDVSVCACRFIDYFQNIYYSKNRILSIQFLLHLKSIHWDLNSGNFIEFKQYYKVTSQVDYFTVEWTFSLVIVTRYSHFITATALKPTSYWFRYWIELVDSFYLYLGHKSSYQAVDYENYFCLDLQYSGFESHRCLPGLSSTVFYCLIVIMLRIFFSLQLILSFNF